MTYSKKELRKKTADELAAMLADEALFISDEENDNIIAIAEVIAEKECKTKSEIKAEDDAFLHKLLTENADIIPIKPKKRAGKPKIKMLPRRALAIAAGFAIVLLATNTVTTFAYNENLFTAIFSFTDEVFKSDVVNPEGSNETPRKENTEYDYKTLEEAFEAFGIISPKAPVIPEGYALRELDTRYFGGSYMARAFYEKGEDTLIISATIYDQTPDSMQRYYEKDDGPLEIFEYGGVEINIFTNLTRRVAVWLDGEGEYSITGILTTEEMKTIIKTMYD
jgi:hypothetical protein